MTLPSAPLTLTLLRHGRSRADNEAVCEGRYDSPLTEIGEAQAAKLAAYWLEHPPGFEGVICSSLIRARRTAEIIGEVLHLEVVPDDAWREFDNGPLAGLSFEAAQRRYPEPAFRHRFAPYTADGGESYAAFARRVNGALEGLVQSPHAKILVVAHGGCLNVTLRDLLHAPAQTSFAFGDTGFSEISVSRQSGQVRLLSLNRMPHLVKEKDERSR